MVFTAYRGESHITLLYALGHLQITYKTRYSVIIIGIVVMVYCLGNNDKKMSAHYSEQAQYFPLIFLILGY